MNAILIKKGPDMIAMSIPNRTILQSYLVLFVMKIAIILGPYDRNYCNHMWFTPITRAQIEAVTLMIVYKTVEGVSEHKIGWCEYSLVFYSQFCYNYNILIRYYFYYYRQNYTTRYQPGKFVRFAPSVRAPYPCPYPCPYQPNFSTIERKMKKRLWTIRTKKLVGNLFTEIFSAHHNIELSLSRIWVRVFNWLLWV